MRTILKSHIFLPGFVYTQGLKPLWKAVLERRGFGFDEQIHWFRVDERKNTVSKISGFVLTGPLGLRNHIPVFHETDTVKPRFTETRIIRTPHCYGQFALSLGKESPYVFCKFNRPLPSSKNPHFQNETKCTTFLVKMSFICMRVKNHFYIKGWALSLVLIQRPRGTRKWPIRLIRTLSIPLPLSVRIDGIWLYMSLCSIRRSPGEATLGIFG